MIFIVSLDVFSDFLVGEQQCLAGAWQGHLRSLGGTVQRRLEDTRKTILADLDASKG